MTGIYCLIVAILLYKTVFSISSHSRNVQYVKSADLSPARLAAIRYQESQTPELLAQVAELKKLPRNQLPKNIGQMLEPNKQIINIIYYDARTNPDFSHTSGNIGDEVNKFIINQLTDWKKFKVVHNQHYDPILRHFIDHNILASGSYLIGAVDNCTIFGSGNKDTKLDIDQESIHSLNMVGVRGPKTLELFQNSKYKQFLRRQGENFLEF